MCGIVGAISKKNVTPLLLACLKKLEYRGYDSAGIAVINDTNNLERQRVVGKISALAKVLEANPVAGTAGIAHTRWATHGEPNVANAHPHFSQNNIALVHNGIIENYEKLRDELSNLGYKFSSQTDTETIAHKIHLYTKNNMDFVKAVHRTIADLKGMYALAILNNAEPNRIVAVRSGSPLVIGFGKDEYLLASDRLALAPIAQKFIYLEEGDIADISDEGVIIYNANLEKVAREIHDQKSSSDMIELGSYRHFMQKEIFEQPHALTETLSANLSYNRNPADAFGKNAAEIFAKVKQVKIVACGTSFHAGLVASYWLEGLAGIPCQIEIASEFRYRQMVINPDTLLVAISQSGETADTLAAIRLGKTLGFAATMAICNVDMSSLTRETDVTFLTRAGTEIGVASTKAFTTQLAGLLLLAIALGQTSGRLQPKTAQKLTQGLRHLPALAEQALALDHQIALLAENFIHTEHAIFLGRGINCPIAMEGALKMKEISYIHAEAYPAGELKHGPLALIDKNMPVIVLAANDELISKLLNNVEEVRARGGKVIMFADNAVKLPNWENDILLVRMPSVSKELIPIIYTIPLQLLAYHVAILKGTDVDQPRNLAKSVTVE